MSVQEQDQLWGAVPVEDTQRHPARHVSGTTAPRGGGVRHTWALRKVSSIRVSTLRGEPRSFLAPHAAYSAAVRAVSCSALFTLCSATK